MQYSRVCARRVSQPGRYYRRIVAASSARPTLHDQRYICAMILHYPVGTPLATLRPRRHPSGLSPSASSVRRALPLIPPRRHPLPSSLLLPSRRAPCDPDGYTTHRRRVDIKHHGTLGSCRQALPAPPLRSYLPYVPYRPNSYPTSSLACALSTFPTPSREFIPRSGRVLSYFGSAGRNGVPHESLEHFGYTAFLLLPKSFSVNRIANACSAAKV